MRVEYSELKEPIKLQQIVFDKNFQKNAIIVQLNPLIIRLDEKSEILLQRNTADLEYYLWTEKDIEEINQFVKKFSNLIS